MSDVSGVLVIDKPAGPTSFDVVQQVRRLLKVKSAGHTGTLDPAASGVLPVCLGDATKIAQLLTSDDKGYEGVVRFGVVTDTLDAQGQVLQTRDASHLTRDVVEAAVAGLLGTQQQVPPMYSALKVDGRRLYELAREGQEVEREAREITVREAALVDWAPPDATIRVLCSKGTYVRSLAETLGERLGTGAHLAALRRTRSGVFTLADAIPLEELARLERPAILGRLLTIERAVANLPALKLDQRTAVSVSFGNALDPATHLACLEGRPPEPAGSKVILWAPDETVVALGEVTGEGGVRLARVLRARTGPGLHKRG